MFLKIGTLFFYYYYLFNPFHCLRTYELIVKETLNVVTKYIIRKEKNYCSVEGIKRNIRTILRYSTREKKRFTIQAQSNSNKKRLHWKNTLTQ